MISSFTASLQLPGVTSQVTVSLSLICPSYIILCNIVPFSVSSGTRGLPWGGWVNYFRARYPPTNQEECDMLHIVDMSHSSWFVVLYATQHLKKKERKKAAVQFQFIMCLTNAIFPLHGTARFDCTDFWYQVFFSTLFFTAESTPSTFL